MMSFGYGGWFVTLPWWSAFLTVLIAALLIWLNVLVLRKAGLSSWWSLLVLFPFLYLIGLWAFAFVRWPRVDGLMADTPFDIEQRRRSPSVDRRRP